MKLKNSQAGFSPVEAVLILVILGIIGGTGWFVYHSRQVADKNLASSAAPSSVSKTTPIISDFVECTKSAGSKVLQTSPEQCVTSIGKTFTQPIQATQTGGYLDVKEWGIKLPLTANTADATYSFSDSGNVTLHFTTKHLQALASQLAGCHPGVDDIYLVRSTLSSSAGLAAVKVGSYYYFRQRTMEAQCLSQENETVTAQIAPIQADLLAAILKIVAN